MPCSTEERGGGGAGKNRGRWGCVRSAAWVLLLISMLCPCFGDIVQEREYIIAVQIAGSANATLQQYGPTFEEYLTKEVRKTWPRLSFKLKPIPVDDARMNIENHLVDFVFLSPNLVMCNNIEFDTAPIATIRKIYDGEYVSAYGTIIFTRTAETEINSIADIKGRVIEATSSQLMQAQWAALERKGISLWDAPKQIRFSGDQAKIVDDVLNKNADFGFVRADFLSDKFSEAYAAGLFKVLDPMPIASAVKYPYPSTSFLIPEYTLAALSDVSFALRFKVALVLSQLNETSPESRRGLHAGFLVPPISMRNMRTIFDQLSLIKKNTSTGLFVCNSPRDTWSSIQCPSGKLRLPQQDVEKRCGLLKESCPSGYTCVCKPCFNATDIEVFPVPSSEIARVKATYFNTTGEMLDESMALQAVTASFTRIEGWGALASPCLNMRLCTLAQQKQMIHIIVVDYLKRGPIVSWHLFEGGLSLQGNQTLTQTQTSVFALTGATISVLSFSSVDVGTLVLDISIGDEQAINSPFLIVIEPRDCTMFHFMEADTKGDCVCMKGYVLVDRDCFSSPDFLSAIIVPIVVAIILVAICLVRRRRYQESVMWKIDEGELVYDEPPKILGSGGYGTVVQARYRGTLVAIKSAGRLLQKHKDDTGTVDNLLRDHRESVSRIVIMRASIGHDDETSDVSGKLALFGSTDSDRACNMGKNADKLKHGQRSEHSVGGWITVGLVKVLEFLCCGCCRSTTKKDQATVDLVEEIKILTMLRHPCITTFMGAVDVEGPTPKLVLECMSGGSLYDMLHTRNDDLDASMIIRILHDVCTGLQFLHSGDPPICHGDVNSKNVLIDGGNRGKVADFGLNHEGHDFAWRGTVRYMAPELFDSHPITSMSDVYSFGILLCECFERQTPYKNLNNKEVVEGVRTGMRPRVPLSCPASAWRLMCMCWETEKRLRPRMDAVAKVLEGMLESGLHGYVIAAKDTEKDEKKKFVLPAVENAKLESEAMAETRNQILETWLQDLHESLSYQEQSLLCSRDGRDNTGMSAASNQKSTSSSTSFAATSIDITQGSSSFPSSSLLASAFADHRRSHGYSSQPGFSMPASACDAHNKSKIEVHEGLAVSSRRTSPRRAPAQLADSERAQKFQSPLDGGSATAVGPTDDSGRSTDEARGIVYDPAFDDAIGGRTASGGVFSTVSSDNESSDGSKLAKAYPSSVWADRGPEKGKDTNVTWDRFHAADNRNSKPSHVEKSYSDRNLRDVRHSSSPSADSQFALKTWTSFTKLENALPRYGSPVGGSTATGESPKGASSVAMRSTTLGRDAHTQPRLVRRNSFTSIKSEEGNRTASIGSTDSLRATTQKMWGANKTASKKKKDANLSGAGPRVPKKVFFTGLFGKGLTDQGGNDQKRQVAPLRAAKKGSNYAPSEESDISGSAPYGNEKGTNKE